MVSCLKTGDIVFLGLMLSQLTCSLRESLSSVCVCIHMFRIGVQHQAKMVEMLLLSSTEDLLCTMRHKLQYLDLACNHRWNLDLKESKTSSSFVGDLAAPQVWATDRWKSSGVKAQSALQETITGEPEVRASESRA